jgi:DNA-binding transcriptional LysR family regulator
MLKLRHIEVFSCIMRTGSVSEASRELHISQPAVSKTLQHAESTLGLALFKRVNGRLQPTPEAGLLFNAASHVEDALYRFNKMGRDLQTLNSGELNIAAAPALATGVIPLAITKLKARYPGIKVSIDAQPNDSIKEQVNYCRADVGIIHFPTKGTDIEAETIQTGELLCILPNSHALAQKKSITADDLLEETLIHCSSGSGWWRSVIKEAIPWLTEQEISIEVNYFTIAYEMVKLNLGIALLDEFSVIGHNILPNNDVAIRPFRPTIPVSFGMLYSRYTPLSQPAHAFRKILQEITYKEHENNYQ